MDSKSLLNSKTITGTLVLVLFIVVQITSVKAQGLRNSNYRYIGFEANFGVKTSKLSSDLAPINKMNLVEEGGSIGLVMGNQLVKGRMQVAGFYYSNSSVKHTVNIVESSLVLNVYPLKFINKSRQAINPYVSGGVDYSTMKFFGFYNETEANKKVNYSSSSAPFLGKVSSTQGTVGAGVEWRLPQMHDFVHLFAEARYSWAVTQDADELFKNTTISSSTSINVGVSFGILR